ncbi:MAG: hypothetical protein DPW14_15480 [Planctomycetes bacterium]|nr:hypothetical protein [Planctomycetota bacterium]
MFKLLAAMFRNIVAKPAPAQTKWRKERNLPAKSLDLFTQTVLFDIEGVVTTDGSMLLQTPYLEAPPKALLGKAFDARDAKALLKALPKGKMRELPIEATYVADDNMLSFRTAGGVKLDVKAVEGHPANWPKWQDKLPKHGEYNEVVVDGKRLKKLVSDAVAQDNALGKSKHGKGYQSKVVLRVSAKPDHPFEIHSNQGVKGFLMPMTDEVKHDRPKKAARPASTALSAGETAKV